MEATYELMLVCEPTIAGKDWNKVVEHCHGLVTQHGGEVLASSKWGDRKLAYEIRGHKRGSYMLVYFKSNTAHLAKINRQAELSDIVVRHLMIQVPGVPPPEEQVAPTPEKASAEKR